MKSYPSGVGWGAAMFVPWWLAGHLLYAGGAVHHSSAGLPDSRFVAVSGLWWGIQLISAGVFGVASGLARTNLVTLRVPAQS